MRIRNIFLIISLILTIGTVSYLYLPKIFAKKVIISGPMTEVEVFVPKEVPTSTKTGDCWTTSISAMSNKHAYRCSVEHYIYDPCFETPDKKIICINDPEDLSKSFVLNLEKPLPERGDLNDTRQTALPWILKLENGAKCWLNSGAAETIGGKESFYACDNQMKVLGTIDFSNDVWSVSTVYIKENPPSPNDFNLKVIKVWE